MSLGGHYFRSAATFWYCLLPTIEYAAHAQTSTYCKKSWAVLPRLWERGLHGLLLPVRQYSINITVPITQQIYSLNKLEAGKYLGDLWPAPPWNRPCKKMGVATWTTRVKIDFVNLCIFLLNSITIYKLERPPPSPHDGLKYGCFQKYSQNRVGATEVFKNVKTSTQLKHSSFLLKVIFAKFQHFLWETSQSVRRSTVCINNK